MKQHRFEVDGTPHLEVRLPLGDLRVTRGTSGSVEVLVDGRESTVERFIVEQRGSVVHIEPETGQRLRSSRLDVTVRIGSPARLHARLTSADLHSDVELAALTVESASGDIFVADVAGDTEIRSASGDIRMGSVAGLCAIASASGDIRVDAAGTVDLKSASGDVVIRQVAGDATARTASGDISVEEFRGDRFTAKSMSGDVVVGVGSGRKYEVAFSTLSGDISTAFPVDDGGEQQAAARLEISTVSGDIRVKKA